MPDPIKVFAANLWVLFNFDDPHERYQQFLSHGRGALKQFIDFILLHDEIVVPTQDFLSLALLVDTFGEQAVLDLLDARCLRFLRLRGSLGYFGTNWGKGSGLSGYEIYEDDNSRQPAAFCAPAELAIASTLNWLPRRPQESDKIAHEVLQVTQEVSIKSIQEEIRRETYIDILHSRKLREWFGPSSIHMSRLAGVAPDALRIYVGPHHNSVDDIDTLLLLAATNLELRLAHIAGCTDSASLTPVGHLIKAKVERVSGMANVAEAFATLREIAEVPDVGETVLSARFPVRHLLRLRQSRDGEQFRQWFHAKCRTDPVATGREYTRLLREVPMISSPRMRLVRLIVTTAFSVIPALSPIVDFAIGAANDFFIESCFRGRSPKFFIENLRQLRNEDRPT